MSQCDPWPSFPLLISIIWGLYLATKHVLLIGFQGVGIGLCKELNKAFMWENNCSLRYVDPKAVSKATAKFCGQLDFSGNP